MKVKELELGMMVSPAGDSEVFRILKITQRMSYLTVSTGKRFPKTYDSNQVAMYVGTRKQANVSPGESSFSNRFVLISGQVVAVDPAAWQRIKRVE